MDMIQMTAVYSNVVLTMVLSNATGVATKLDLPIIKPVRPAHTWRFVCDPRKDSIGGWLSLTNGYEFWYFNGYIDSMESSHSYFGLQDPDQIPQFFGTIRMTEAEVIQMARHAVRKLGYNPPWLESRPVVEAARTAPRDRPNVIPHFRVKWEGIDQDGMSWIVEIEINADAKRVEKYWLNGKVFHRKPPSIPQPPAIPQPPPSPPIGGQRLTPLVESQRVVALTEICSKATEMAKRLGLPVKLPIIPSAVKEADIGLIQGELLGQIILAGGWRFNYNHGLVSSFHAPDSEAHIGKHEVWTNMPLVDIRKLPGKVRYTKKQVGELAAKQVRKLGYPDSVLFLDQPISVYGGPTERSPKDVRYYVRWESPGTEDLEDPKAQLVGAEVDGVTLELKALWLRSTNLYRHSIIKP